MAKSPVKVCVTGAAGLIAYSLIPQIAAGAMFGPEQPVIISMLDIEPCRKGLDGLAMELEDMVNPLLQGVIATTNPDEAFSGCDYAVLCGAFPRGPGMERKDLLLKNAAIFHAQGISIAAHAKKEIKVLVVGNPANTNAMILRHFGGLPEDSVHAMTRLDHNRARNMLARKIGGGAQGHEIKNLIVWGNHSPTMYPDVRHATYNGKSVREVINDDAWIEQAFLTDVAQRGTTVIKTRGSSSATSAARAIIDHVRDWFLGNAEEYVSMGVYSDGTHYGLPAGVIYSLPCRALGGGRVEIVDGLEIDDFSKKLIVATATELEEEKVVALSSFN